MKFRFIAILLAACMLMCGCSTGISVENLLTTPKLTAEQNEIYDALINSVNQNIKLKYPRSGDYRSAFVLQNIDNEPGEEAIVFYESKNGQSGESSLRLMFLDKNDGKWEAVYDLSCRGSEVDSISFAKLGSDGSAYIVVCYTLLNQSEKWFSVIKYDGTAPTELHTSSYACLKVFDLNGDGFDELFSVSVDKVNQVSVASLFTDGEDGFVKLSETALSSGAFDYLRVTEGQLLSNKPALFLDYSKGGGQSSTDVVYCYGNSLYTPDPIDPVTSTPIVSRLINSFMSEIYCYDIDGDGFTEIPSTVPLPGYEVLTKPEQLCAVTWYSIKDDKYVMEHYSYFSGRYRFALLFPNRWRYKVTARTEFDTNDIVFVNSENNAEILRIRSVDKGNADAVAAAKDYRVLGENEETLYCIIESGGFGDDLLKLTESELKNSFFVL